MEHTIKTARPIVEAMIDARTPVMLAGSPGIGKSELVGQIARGRDWGCITLSLSTLDAVDIRGLPAVRDDSAVFMPMGELPRVERDGPNGILFLDELPQAPMAVQNAAFSLVWERRIGEYKLPDGWHVISAGNRVEDRAGAGRVNSALANRFAHIELVSDVDAWCKWALGNGIAAELVAFIRFRPELLDAFNPDRKVNPTPRTWAMVAPHIGAGHDKETEFGIMAAIIGDEASAELSAFLRIWRSLPSVDGIFLDPRGAIVPTDSATLYATCGAIARKVTAQSMAPFVEYIGRLPAEYGVLAMHDATRRDESLTKTPEAIAYFANNADTYL